MGSRGQETAHTHPIHVPIAVHTKHVNTCRTQPCVILSSLSSLLLLLLLLLLLFCWWTFTNSASNLFLAHQSRHTWTLLPTHHDYRHPGLCRRGEARRASQVWLSNNGDCIPPALRTPIHALVILVVATSWTPAGIALCGHGLAAPRLTSLRPSLVRHGIQSHRLLRSLALKVTGTQGHWHSRSLALKVTGTQGHRLALPQPEVSRKGSVIE